MKLDLSKKPEGATHINPHSGLWVKCFGGNSGSYQFFNNGEWEMGFGCMSNSYLEIAQPEPWAGKGLPPVGTVCEFQGDCAKCPSDPSHKELHDGVKCTVIAHFKSKTLDLVAFTFVKADGNSEIEQSLPGALRPIRTPEQIAANERQRAAMDIGDILIANRGSCSEYHQAGLIYDAGYRKQV